MGGANNQLQATNLMRSHFEKDEYSTIKNELVMQILSDSLVKISQEAMSDDDIKIHFQN